MVNSLPAMQETQVRFLGLEGPLEKEMATHSRILAWKTPWAEEPGGLQPIVLQRVGHDWVTSLTHSLIVYYQEKVFINEKSLKAGNRFSVQNSQHFLSCLSLTDFCMIATLVSFLFFLFWPVSYLAGLSVKYSLVILEFSQMPSYLKWLGEYSDHLSVSLLNC